MSLPQTPEAQPQPISSPPDLLRAEAMLRAKIMLGVLFDHLPIEQSSFEAGESVQMGETDEQAIVSELEVLVAPRGREKVAEERSISSPPRAPITDTPRRIARSNANETNKVSNLMSIKSVEIKSADTRLQYDQAMPGFLGYIPESWEESALCTQVDPEIFFPEKGGSTREAKKICATCEVRDACLEAALKRDERFGIWGGLSERERRRLKRAF